MIMTREEAIAEIECLYGKRERALYTRTMQTVRQGQKHITGGEYCCPACGWFVGRTVDVFGRKHTQEKKNFCDRCGQRIDWEGVNSGE